MPSWMKNQIANLYNFVSPPVTVTREAFAERLLSESEIAVLLYNRMVGNVDYGRERLKDIVEKEAREKEKETKDQEEEQTKDNIDLTATENERALKGAYRRFVIPGILKADIDSYVDQGLN